MSRGLTLAFLHAFGDDGESLRGTAARLSLLLGKRVARVVILEGSRRAGKGRAWVSWECDDAREIARARERVVRLIARKRRETVVLFGFSQGAMLALECAFASRLAPAAVVLVGAFLAPGGLARERARVVAARKRPRVLFLHGKKDDDVPLAEARRALACVKELGAEGELVVFPRAKHEVTLGMVERAARFLKALGERAS